MNHWRIWLAAAAVLMSMAGQVQAKLEWTEPGRAPYEGSDENALRSFAQKVLIPGTYERIPRQILDRQFELWRGNECTRRDIQPNEYFGYMLFGRSLAERDVRARTKVWKSSISVALTECIVVDYERNLVFKLQRPDVCHNWTYTIAPLLPPLGWRGPFPADREEVGYGGGSGSHASPESFPPLAGPDDLGGAGSSGPFVLPDAEPAIFSPTVEILPVPAPLLIPEPLLSNPEQPPSEGSESSSLLILATILALYGAWRAWQHYTVDRVRTVAAYSKQG